MLNVKLKILDKRLGTEFPLPRYETAGSAGMDLRAMLPEDAVLKPGQTLLVPAGFAMHIEDPKIFGAIYPRSGLGSKKGIVLGNLTGVIDSDYQGQIMMPLWNRSEVDYLLKPGERVAQLIFMPVIRAQWEICEDFEESLRGERGFGSTGS